jgi:Ca-activated chloride channel family protein
MGGGACDLVESEDRLDAVMDKIHHRISAPLLTGVRLEAPLLGIDESSVTPARAPDLHPGVPLVLMGRYRSKSDKAADSISIAARDSRGEDWTTSIRATPSVSGAIASQWARGHIRDLEDRYAAGSSDLDSLEKRIVAVSLAHQVLSRFTAFVAVDRSSVVNTDGNQMQIVQPVELPSGWERHGSERFCAYSADAVRFRTMDVAPMLAGGAHRVSDSASLAMRERMPDFCLFEASLGESERELDLTSYKGSVAQWLAAMAAVSTGDVAAQSRLLRELVSDLRDLLAALVGVGAAADVLRPLASLFENLRGQLQRDASNPEEVARLWQEALRVLGEFSGEFSAARLAFWKK